VLDKSIGNASKDSVSRVLVPVVEVFGVGPSSPRKNIHYSIFLCARLISVKAPYLLHALP